MIPITAHRLPITSLLIIASQKPVDIYDAVCYILFMMHCVIKILTVTCPVAAK